MVTLTQCQCLLIQLSLRVTAGYSPVSEFVLDLNLPRQLKYSDDCGKKVKNSSFFPASELFYLHNPEVT